MVHRFSRMPVWLGVAALCATIGIGRSASAAPRQDVQRGFQIVIPGLVITRDLTPDIGQIPQINPAQGVLISDVVYSPLLPNDVILSINGNPVWSQADIDVQLAQVMPG